MGQIGHMESLTADLTLLTNVTYMTDLTYMTYMTGSNW